VMVRKAASESSFPDVDVPFNDPLGVVFDRLDGRDRLLVSMHGVGRSGNREIIEDDLASGKRSVYRNFAGIHITSIWVIDIDENNSHLYFRDDAFRIATLDLDDPSQITIQTIESLGRGYALVVDDSDPEQLRIVAPNGNNGNVLHVTSDLTKADIYSDNTNNELGVSMGYARFIAFDKKNNRYLLTSELEQIVYSVDSDSGMRDIFTGNGIGDGDSFSSLGVAGVAGVAIDNTNQRV